MDTHRTRGERRYQTARRSWRAWRLGHYVAHGPRRRHCSCPASAARYRKAHAFSCRCRGKQKGAPKLAGSLHKADDKYRAARMRRIWNKRLVYAWFVAAGDPDDLELPSGPTIGRGRRKQAKW